MIKQQFWSKILRLLAARVHLSTWLVTPAMLLGVTVLFPQPSQAVTKINITCGLRNNTPTILGVISNEYRSQDTEILSFIPKYFSPQAALKKCQTTASTLQRLYDTDEMNYLSSDTLDGKPTVCVVERRGVACDSHNSHILFTLNQTVDPSKVLYDMLGEGFKQSQFPTNRTLGRIYTNIKPSWWPF